AIGHAQRRVPGLFGQQPAKPLAVGERPGGIAAAVQVQETLNAAAGIGIKAQTTPFNVSRVDGIVGRVSAAEKFDEVAWILNAPVVNFSQAIADDTLKANVDFQGKAGLHPKVIRKAERKCCEWCSRLEGEYTYPDVPKDVYRRHANCRCDVNYDPGSGKRQNVWTKQWAEPEEVAAREARKKFSMQNELVKYASVRYNQDGTVIVTDDWKKQKRVSVPSHYAPNAVVETQTAYRDGTIQINRTFYDDSGWMKLQVHSGNHERPHTHRFGTDGSEPCHKHLYKRTESGVVRDGKAVSLTAEDKTRNRDILQEVKK
ncbi:MAG: hypothetical protein RSD23_09145, partial [Ruthenibacterium sp.]